jgi:hypothetical protein
MNKEILNLIHLYSKESKFADNLKELINILNVKLHLLSNCDNSNNVLHKFYNSSEFSLKNEVIEPILHNMIKTNVEINKTTVPWSNGNDGNSDLDVVEYKIKYTLNEHELTFNIHSLVDENTIIHAGVFFDDWLHFIVVNHDGELGYYQQDGDIGIQLYYETKGELFYNEFNTKNIYNNIKEFYEELLMALFSSISNELGHTFDDFHTFDDLYVEFV